MSPNRSWITRRLVRMMKFNNYNIRRENKSKSLNLNKKIMEEECTAEEIER